MKLQSENEPSKLTKKRKVLQRKLSQAALVTLSFLLFCATITAIVGELRDLWGEEVPVNRADQVDIRAINYPHGTDSVLVLFIFPEDTTEIILYENSRMTQGVSWGDDEDVPQGIYFRAFVRDPGTLYYADIFFGDEVVRTPTRQVVFRPAGYDLMSD